jgi:hypothetical protein
MTNTHNPKKYAIKLTSARSKRVHYLHSYRTGLRSRITRTSYLQDARKFATEADAQQFINENQIYFLGLNMEVAS